jgi:hypothetical protein
MAIDLGYDESGDGNDKLLVSVQVGITEPAKRFRRHWKSALLKANDLAFFHSKDFGNYAGGVFTKANLDRPRREILVGDLCSLIHRHLLFGITTRVKISEYNELTTPKFRSRYGTAFGFAIDMCLLSAYALVTAKGYKPEFNVLIEQGHRNAAQVVQILDSLQKIPQEIIAASPGDAIQDIKILTKGLGEKKEHPILQAADMLAYSDWQGMSEGDDAIWAALHRNGLQYRTWRVHGDKNLIQMFMNEGARPFLQTQRSKAKEV